jgi:hypothetical protein
MTNTGSCPALQLLLVVFGAGCAFDPAGLRAPRPDAGRDGGGLEWRVDAPGRLDADGFPEAAVDLDSSDTAEDGPSDSWIDALADGPIDAPAPDVVVPPDTLLALPAGTLTVDGDLSDWSGRGWRTIGAPADWIGTGGTAGGASDISARFAARWTADGLYLAFEVTDDVHRNDHARQTDVLWQGDSVQVGLDVGNNGGSAYDSTDDFEYGWALAGAQLIQHRWHAPAGAAAPANVYAVVRAGGTTSYEIRLPPGDLGLAGLGVGDSFGFSTLVNDDDGGQREGYVEWTSGIGSGKNPAAFGTLRLEAR